MLQTITQITEQHLIIIAAVIFISLIVYLSRKKIKHYWLNFKTYRQLNRLGIEQLINVQWPDGLGHYFTIDRLVMRNDAISLIMYKCYPGKIFCADHIDEWTQMLGQRSYSFENPLHELDYQINTLSASIPDIPVNGYLFFDHLSEFPKGHPDRVIHSKKIPDELIGNKQDSAQQDILDAWQQLIKIKV
ncbi:MAG: NERD domain-containing protein [Gammaproteobacteria bacterium]|nr:NERD domain-containing protein [Gammaproteobacteria bacterium]